MIETQIRRNSPTLGEAEAAAAANAVLANWAGRGPETAFFENEFCELHGLSEGHAVAVSSGSAALYLALSAFGAGGKRVAVPAYACQPLSHAVRAVRAEPVIIDSRSVHDPNADVDVLGASGAQIAIVSHSFGIPQIIGAQPALIIEDCAQSLGAFAGGARVGLQGAVAVFSFGPTKMITAAGAGGMLLSKDDRCIEYVRDFLAYYDRSDDRLRFNFEITDVQSAVGRVQLRRLPEFVARREELFSCYRRSGAVLLTASDPRVFPVRFGAVVLSDNLPELQRALTASGIPVCRPLEPRHLLGSPGGNPNAHGFASRALSLPLYPSLSDADATFVTAALASAAA
ncbi:MAG TPA: DegT/DnrJ/EryC1/StrS family aminotransferase [Candidatus Rubrimentiphilum sp.]|nr:DegT/DnrJ/EryC1/StrS family aminotransferase [Candidatus Rubrimentiphilum sp.]